jgi:hypothetical protein
MRAALCGVFLVGCLVAAILMDRLEDVKELREAYRGRRLEP